MENKILLPGEAVLSTNELERLLEMAERERHQMDILSFKIRHLLRDDPDSQRKEEE